jgi:endonuclease/exonuclease/phosphatase family metal-dependent hydrolase
MRIATFNVENLFERPRAMNLPTWKEGQPALDAAAKLNALFMKEEYKPADKRKMLELLEEWGLLSTRPRNKFLELRKIRGTLLKRTAGVAEIVAGGRKDWVGSVELKKATIEDEAIENTARVIAEVNPDVLVVVEVEHRPALQRFHDAFVAPLQRDLGLETYPHNMVIDGNDPRGIDVGILSRFPIARMRSHITDAENGKSIFSRDCPEYYITLDDGRELVILPNHLASKGSDKTGDRRRQQAHAVRAIYEEVRKTHDLVVVAGDFNDHPDGGSLTELLTQTDLVDAMALPVYSGLPGTYQRGNAKEKFDYLLLSPVLRDNNRVHAVDVFRKGFYAPKKWESFENISIETKDRFQASDHHCVWADIDL